MTSPPPDDLERRLRDTLTAGLSPVSADTVMTDAVVHRSVRIRRQRRVAVGAAAGVAALAVAVPLAFSSLGGSRTQLPPAGDPGTARSGTAAAPTQGSLGAPTTPGAVPTSAATTSAAVPPTGATTGPTPAPSSTPVPDRAVAEAATVVRPTDLPAIVAVNAALPTAAAPRRLVWSQGSTVHRYDVTQDGQPSQTSFPDTQSGMRYLALSEGRALVWVQGVAQLGGSLVVVGSDQKVVTTLAQVGPNDVVAMAASADGARAAFQVHPAADDGKLHDSYVIDASGKTVLHKTNTKGGLAPVGFVGDKLFLANVFSGKSHVWDLSTNVIEAYLDKGRLVSVDEASRTGAYITQFDDAAGTACTTVADVSGLSAKPLLTSCGLFVPDALSPGGRYLVGATAAELGPDMKKLVLDTQTGRYVQGFSAPTLATPVWVDDSSFVVSLSMPGDSAPAPIARCTVAGACSVVAHPDTNAPYADVQPAAPQS